MIVTITFSPAIDKYGEVENVKYEDTMRMKKVSYDAGGKGINVSRVCKRFGINAPAIYFSGGRFGSIFTNLLEEEKIDCEPVSISENTRINYTVFNQKERKVFKFNDPGPVVDEIEIDKMLSVVKTYAKKNNILVFAGNLPPNLDKKIYAKFINEIKDDVKFTFLDTESDILVTTLEDCSPDLIKPNISETGRILGKEMKTEADFIQALELMKDKVKFPLVSAADRGVFFKNNDDDIYYNIVPPQVDPVSTVGAGDSFVAGYVMSIEEGKSMLEAVKMGVSCGTATVLTPGTSLCYPNDVLDIFNKVEVKKIS